VRLGDSIIISQAEAEVLQSDTFRRLAAPGLTSNILLTPSGAGYYSLALPNVGRQIIGVLSAFAASGVQAEAAITAEGLAVAIAQRISPG
jgi:hypothetical protein